MKKINILIMMLALVLVGCTAKIEDNSAILKEYSDAMNATKSLDNYTLSNSVKQTNEIDDIKYSVQNDEIVYSNNGDNKNEVSIYNSTNYEFEGTSEVTESNLWYKDGSLYLEEAEAKQKTNAEYTEFMTLYMQNITMSAYDTPTVKKLVDLKVIEDAKYYKLELDPEYVKELAGLLFGLDETKLTVQKGTLEYEIQNGFVKSREFDIEVSVDSEKLKTHTIISQAWSNEGTTVVEYPLDLEAFTVSQDTPKDSVTSIEGLRKSLIEKYGYEVDSENESIVMYDWGTEIYIFNFEESTFSIKTNKDLFVYNWNTDRAEVIGSTCTYDFINEESKDCTEEELENMKLTKEVFLEELAYNDVLLSEIK